MSCLNYANNLFKSDSQLLAFSLHIGISLCSTVTSPVFVSSMKSALSFNPFSQGKNSWMNF